MSIRAMEQGHGSRGRTTSTSSVAGKETIHSGHFMVSDFEPESEAQDEEYEVGLTIPPGSEGEQVVIQSPEEESFFQAVTQQKRSKSVSFSLATEAMSREEQIASAISIDVSLTKLFQCMSLAYRQKLTSPKWNRFKGVRLRWKDKIRLNNVIWRCWHMQFILKKKTPVCQFASPLDVDGHNKPEAVVMEGKYWKRKLSTVAAEYKKWRLFYRNRIMGWSHAMPTQDLHPVSLDGFDWNKPNNFGSMSNIIFDDDMFMDFTDTLFSSLSSNQPFAFPNPRELSRAGMASDFIQPGLVQLQPSLDDFMDTLEPFQDFVNSKLLPPVPEELESFAGDDSLLGEEDVLPIKPPHSFPSQTNHHQQQLPAPPASIHQQPIVTTTNGGGFFQSANLQFPQPQPPPPPPVPMQLDQANNNTNKVLNNNSSNNTVKDVFAKPHGKPRGRARSGGARGGGGSQNQQNHQQQQINNASSNPTLLSHLLAGTGTTIITATSTPTTNSAIPSSNVIMPATAAGGGGTDYRMGGPINMIMGENNQPNVAAYGQQQPSPFHLPQNNQPLVINFAGMAAQQQQRQGATTPPQKPFSPPATTSSLLGHPATPSPPLIGGHQSPPASNMGPPPTSPFTSGPSSPSKAGIIVRPNKEGGERNRGHYKVEHRRVCHINAEQKRRCNIKNGFDTLHSLIPQLSHNPNAKVSKAAMLAKGAEYIRQLKVERAQLKEEIEAHRTEVEALNASISNCQSLLPATGAPVSRQRTSKMMEMFNNWVRQRTMENWKFWLFSTLVRPLLDSYNNSVSTASVDELCRTVLAWVDQHCSLVDLRPAVLSSLRQLCTSTDILSNPGNLQDEAYKAVNRQISQQQGHQNERGGSDSR